MNHRHRLETCAKQFNRAVDRFQFDLGQSAKFVVGVEDVAEHVAQKLGCRRVGVERQLARLVLETERAQIVDAENVVGVGVGVEDGIDAVIFSRSACSRKSGVVSMRTLWSVVADHH